MDDEKVVTKHPQGKTGRRISKTIYDNLKREILSALKDRELTHDELLATLEKRLSGKITGNVGWYGETVKLDLEARKMIKRTPSKPQKYTLVY